MKRLMILIALLALLVACTQSPPARPTYSVPTAPAVSEPAQPIVQAPPVPKPIPVVEKSVVELEADDDGFYLKGERVGSVTVKKNVLLEITFNVRTTEVYNGGLDFRGCTKEGSAKPGESVTLSFTPAGSCIIKSFWPATGVLKDSIELKVE